MSAILSKPSILAGAIVLAGLFGCGTFQQQTKEAAKTSDVNDEFFKEDSKSNPATALKTQPAKTVKPADEKNNAPENKDVITDVERGYASWYGKELQGKPTASGQMFDMNLFTGAHRTYPLGSLVLVRNLENGKKKLVVINDRGPYVDGRIIDVSYAVARDLEFAEKGVAKVEVELIEKAEENLAAKAPAPESEVEAQPQETPETSDSVEKVSSKDDIFFADGLKPQNFTVRTGAFKKLKNAEKYREDLEDKYNLNAFLGKKGKWHYVWIGDFEDKESAKKFYQKLKTDGLDVLNPGKVQ